MQLLRKGYDINHDAKLILEAQASQPIPLPHIQSPFLSMFHGGYNTYKHI